RRVGGEATLVARHLEAPGLSGRVLEQSVYVGRLVLLGVSHQPSLATAETPLVGHCVRMKHTRLGYWIEEAGAVTPRPPLREDRDADVLIVGGGYTGMWTAWHAHRLAPDARIVILESEPVCGRGPSGRNGGLDGGPLGRAAGARRRGRRRGSGAPRRRLLHRGGGGRRLVPAGGLHRGLD